MAAEWRTIHDFPEYEVSNDGAVRSWRKPIDGRRSHRAFPHQFSPTSTRLGYQQVMLMKPGSTKKHRRLIHRLVAEAFIPNPLGLSDVAHGDGNPRNSDVANLRWTTHRDNQMDMRVHGTMQDGEKCCTAKLSKAQVVELRLKCATGPRGTQRAEAARLGMSVAQVCRIVNGRRWASIAVAGVVA
jgi:hypothetical protein